MTSLPYRLKRYKFYYDRTYRHFDNNETQAAYHCNIYTTQNRYIGLSWQQSTAIVNAYYDGEVEKL